MHPQLIIKIISMGAFVGGKVEGYTDNSQCVLVVAAGIAALLARPAQRRGAIAILCRPVLQCSSHRARLKAVDTHIGAAHIIQVVSGRQPVYYLEREVHPALYPPLYTRPYREAWAYSAVLTATLPCILPLSAQWP